MQPSIKQEMAEHLAAMMSPPAFSRGPGARDRPGETGAPEARGAGLRRSSCSCSTFEEEGCNKGPRGSDHRGGAASAAS